MKTTELHCDPQGLIQPVAEPVKHTPGRLRVSEHARSFRLVDDNCRVVAECAGQTEKDQANAERLALVWNTHAQLVEALEDIMAGLAFGQVCKLKHAQVDLIRAALAAARGAEQEGTK